MRDLLSRVDARLLREEAGIRTCTVARALGVGWSRVHGWETGRMPPHGPEGQAWLRVIVGLQRHALVTAGIAARGRRAA